MPLCIPHQTIDAFHESEDDEHSIFYVPKHREDEYSCAKEDSRATIQQHLSICTHQDDCGTSVGIARHCLGRFNFP